MIFDSNILNIILLLLLFKIFYNYNKSNVEKFDPSSNNNPINNVADDRGIKVFDSTIGVFYPVKRDLQQTIDTEVPSVINLNSDTTLDQKNQQFLKMYNNDAKVLSPEKVIDINKMVNSNVFTDIQNIDTNEVDGPKDNIVMKYPIFAPLPLIRNYPISKVGPFKVLDNIDYYKQIDIN